MCVCVFASALQIDSYSKAFALLVCTGIFLVVDLVVDLVVVLVVVIMNTSFLESFSRFCTNVSYVYLREWSNSRFPLPRHQEHTVPVDHRPLIFLCVSYFLLRRPLDSKTKKEANNHDDDELLPQPRRILYCRIGQVPIHFRCHHLRLHVSGGPLPLSFFHRCPRTTI